MIVFALDCGYTNSGYCVFDTQNEVFLEIDHIVAKHDLFSEKLLMIHDRIKSVFDQFHPEFCVFEEPVFLGKGKTGALLHQALGVVKLIAAQEHSEIIGYTAPHVKKLCTGDGKADKKKIEHEVCNHFKLDSSVFPSNHASDAVAVLLCFLKTKIS